MKLSVPAKPLLGSYVMSGSGSSVKVPEDGEEHEPTTGDPKFMLLAGSSLPASTSSEKGVFSDKNLVGFVTPFKQLGC